MLPESEFDSSSAGNREPPTPQEGARFRWALVLVLRGGAILAAALFATGLAIYFVRGDRLALDARLRQPLTDAGLVSRFAHGDALTVITLGLVVLIGLPIARVILSLFHFIAERDRLYVLLTSAVLALLFTGVLLGRAM